MQRFLSEVMHAQQHVSGPLVTCRKYMNGDREDQIHSGDMLQHSDVFKPCLQATKSRPPPLQSLSTFGVLRKSSTVEDQQHDVSRFLVSCESQVLLEISR